ncbi:hypothetical protein MRX96_028653 [Rhipicephalus microplus]
MERVPEVSQPERNATRRQHRASRGGPCDDPLTARAAEGGRALAIIGDGGGRPRASPGLPKNDTGGGKSYSPGVVGDGPLLPQRFKHGLCQHTRNERKRNPSSPASSLCSSSPSGGSSDGRKTFRRTGAHRAGLRGDHRGEPQQRRPPVATDGGDTAQLIIIRRKK